MQSKKSFVCEKIVLPLFHQKTNKMNSKLIEANTLVVNHRLQYNVVYCDLVKGYFLSNKFTFDDLNTFKTSVLIDKACNWLWIRGHEKEANIIFNSYLYNYKTFLHNYNNLFN